MAAINSSRESLSSGKAASILVCTHSQLTVIERVDADTYKPSESLGTGNDVRTMALHPVTTKIYAVTSEGSADYAKKITSSVSPFYANVFFADRFTVQTYSKQ
jgi:hypothetical protein